jgi:hypothetical protein
MSESVLVMEVLLLRKDDFSNGPDLLTPCKEATQCDRRGVRQVNLDWQSATVLKEVHFLLPVFRLYKYIHRHKHTREQPVDLEESQPRCWSEIDFCSVQPAVPHCRTVALMTFRHDQP